MNTNAMTPITEDDIAHYLVNTPDFFARHAEMLSAVQITSPHGQRAVSLQERQAEMLREKIKVLESRLMDMLRHGNENVIIADKMHRWVRDVLLTIDPVALPQRMADELKAQFLVPQVAIRVWGVAERFADQAFASGVSEDARSLASSLTAPYVGINSGFEAVSWLEEPSVVMSAALVPLRPGAIHSTAPAFGLLVLGSPDPQRFHSGMGTDFLERIGELASAALMRLRP
jgi:uncharacterized protein YigA (DUF484 family)